MEFSTIILLQVLKLPYRTVLHTQLQISMEKRAQQKLLLVIQKLHQVRGIVVTATNRSQINTALKKGPVLMKFGAEWCPYCKALDSTLKQLATEYNGKATIMSVDIDKSSKFADSFGVNDIPDTCVIVSMKNGKYVYMQQSGKTTTDISKAKIIGYEDKNVYEKVLNFALK